jgi:hypothetical protein
VDYFGPIEVTIFRRVVKRWGVIFTCLNCRCVHLEMAYSLDTSSFICCLDRFMNRRGVPATLHGGNGTNFLGAQRQLAECLDNLSQSAIIGHLNRKMTKWYFNPPAAPHFRGVWERMVRAAKEALVADLGKQRLTDELLITTLTHIENVLNSRANPNTPPDVFDKDDLTARERWRVVQAISDHIWQRWMREVVPSLTEREKWYQDQPNLEIGDIVIIIDRASPRGTWPTGQVIQVIAGPDKIVRSAVVQSNGNERHRPAHKLFLLESVRIRNANASAERRAGDVGESKTSKKSVTFNDPLSPSPATTD